MKLGNKGVTMPRGCLRLGCEQDLSKEIEQIKGWTGHLRDHRNRPWVHCPKCNAKNWLALRSGKEEPEQWEPCTWQEPDDRWNPFWRDFEPGPVTS